MKKFVFIPLLLLAACATPEQVAEQKRLLAEQDRQTCREYGFRPRSEAFSNCLLELEIARQQQQQYYYDRYDHGPHLHGSYYYFRH